jgi:hypothetical protein
LSSHGIDVSIHHDSFVIHAGARILFAYLDCPLCHQRIEHDSLTALMQPHLTLEKRVQTLALERFNVEGVTYICR